jgi:hypothetical protein
MGAKPAGVGTTLHIIVLAKIVVLGLLFSAGLVAVLSSLEPPNIITCWGLGHRLIVGAKELKEHET